MAGGGNAAFDFTTLIAIASRVFAGPKSDAASS
jgi:hypothetical protein